MMELSTHQAPTRPVTANQSATCHLLADAPTSVDRDAHLRAALANVGPVGDDSKRVHALVVGDLATDLPVFAQHFGLALDAPRAAAHRENKGTSASVDIPADVVADLRHVLRHDFALYDAVRSARAKRLQTS